MAKQAQGDKPKPQLTYYGATPVDQRCSSSIVPWIIAEVQAGSPDAKQVRQTIDGDEVEARDAKTNIAVLHLKAITIIRLCQSSNTAEAFAYLVRNSRNTRFLCHVFAASSDDDALVALRDVKRAMRVAHSASVERVTSSDDVKMDESSFRVDYVGKRRVDGPRGSKTLVDDVLLQIRKTKRKKSTEAGDGFSADCTFTVNAKWVKLTDSKTQTIHMQKVISSVAYCSQGLSHLDYVGVVCEDAKDGHFSCYVLRAAPPKSPDPILDAVKNAFRVNYENFARATVCDSCPMHHLHNLCTQIEGLSVERSQSIINRAVEALPETAYAWVKEKFEKFKNASGKRQNVAMMSLLRAVCEKQQQTHTHPENAQAANVNVSPSTDDPNRLSIPRRLTRVTQSLVGSFESLLRKDKSKASRFSSFQGEMKRKAVKSLTVLANADTKSRSSSPTSRRSSTPTVKRGDSPTFSAGDSDSPRLRTKVPNFMYIMKKVTTPPARRKVSEGTSPASSVQSIQSRELKRKISFRQSIYMKVQTPNRQKDGVDVTDGKTSSTSLHQRRDSDFEVKEKKTSDDYRKLWQKAINEQIMLLRMEKFNSTLEADMESAEMKRHKLSYEDSTPDIVSLHYQWNNVLATPKPQTLTLAELKAAVLNGIPKERRGEVWSLLMERRRNLKSTNRFSSFSPATSPDATDSPGVHFQDLKEKHTKYQHQIFMDLSRTFPHQRYFSKAMGPGQQAMYSILKAYAVMDPEMGYCQGLSFIAAVFIVHTKSESDAFNFLKTFLIDYDFRNQYLPLMEGLQVRLYQLSRLLHDLLPDVYEHLDVLDVPPFFYAAPWFLTIFASQFPLGFSSRVMDYVLLEGEDALFKITLSLLQHFESTILDCRDFESTTDFLKNTLPQLTTHVTNEIIANAMRMELDTKLQMFEVEYNVLKEAMINEKTDENEQLKQTVQEMKAEIARLKEKHKDLLRKYDAERDGRKAAEEKVASLEKELAMKFNQKNSNGELIGGARVSEPK